MNAHLLGPSQPAAIAEVTITTWSSPPFRRDLCMAIRTVLFGVALLDPPLPLLLAAEQRLQLFSKYPVLALHLPELELPARAAGCLQLVKDVIF